MIYDEVFIYKITNIVNKKFYIGHTTDLEKRVSYHKENLEKNSHACFDLQYDFNEFGKPFHSIFNISILKTLKNIHLKHVLKEEEQTIKENKYINAYNINLFPSSEKKNPNSYNYYKLNGRKNRYIPGKSLTGMLLTKSKFSNITLKLIWWNTRIPYSTIIRTTENLISKGSLKKEGKFFINLNK